MTISPHIRDCQTDSQLVHGPLVQRLKLTPRRLQEPLCTPLFFPAAY
jgi:hypothetical protein